MKLWQFLKRHKWSVRLIILSGVLTAFVLAELSIFTYQNQLDARVTSAESLSGIVASKSIVADKERAAVKKTADDAAAKKASEVEVSKKQDSLPLSTVYSTAPHRDPRNIDVVANKKNPLLPGSYTPSVVAVSCAGNGTITVQVQAREDLIALCTAAVEAGVPLSASSSYRSYSYQVTVYNRWVAQSGQAQADTFSARAGYSEHQTGFAIDFRVPGGATLGDFTGTAQQQWLAVQGVNYGFIQRYTDANITETGYIAEPWHYRYIGKTNAAAYVASGKASLESFWGVVGGDY